MHAAFAEHDEAWEATLDSRSLLAFLESEAMALRNALTSPGDRGRALRALRSHDEAHETWITLTGKAERSGQVDLARALVGLYSLHGQIAARLARGFRLLHPAVEQRLRIVLLIRLERLTSETVERVLALDQPPRFREVVCTAEPGADPDSR